MQLAGDGLLDERIGEQQFVRHQCACDRHAAATAPLQASGRCAHLQG